jgi:hypothetical protein
VIFLCGGGRGSDLRPFLATLPPPADRPVRLPGRRPGRLGRPARRGRPVHRRPARPGRRVPPAAR